MEKDNEKIFVLYLTEEEFNYSKDLFTTFYDNLSKLPKKMRTSKFYSLESIIKKYFSE